MNASDRIPAPLRHDVLADVERILGGTPVATPAELEAGDVLASSWFPGLYITVTATPRHFLGEVIVDYVTETGKHGTCHFRVDIPCFARYLATRPAAASCEHVAAGIVSTWDGECFACGWKDMAR